MQGQRVQTIRRILQESRGKAVLVFDDVDIIAALSGDVTDYDMIGILRSKTQSSEYSSILMMDETYPTKLGALEKGLLPNVEVIRLKPPTCDTLYDISWYHTSGLEQYHGLKISDAAIRKSIEPPAYNSKRVHQGLLVSRLDAACLHAALAGKQTVEAADLILDDYCVE